MSIPTAVFLDTSILDGQNYNFLSVALTSLVDLAKEQEDSSSYCPTPRNEKSSDTSARDRQMPDARSRPQNEPHRFSPNGKHFPQVKELKGRDWELESIATKDGGGNSYRNSPSGQP